MTNSSWPKSMATPQAKAQPRAQVVALLEVAQTVNQTANQKAVLKAAQKVPLEVKLAPVRLRLTSKRLTSPRSMPKLRLKFLAPPPAKAAAPVAALLQVIQRVTQKVAPEVKTAALVRLRSTHRRLTSPKSMLRSLLSPLTMSWPKSLHTQHQKALLKVILKVALKVVLKVAPEVALKVAPKVALTAVLKVAPEVRTALRLTLRRLSTS